MKVYYDLDSLNYAEQGSHLCAELFDDKGRAVYSEIGASKDFRILLTSFRDEIDVDKESLENLFPEFSIIENDMPSDDSKDSYILKYGKIQIEYETFPEGVSNLCITGNLTDDGLAFYTGALQTYCDIIEKLVGDRYQDTEYNINNSTHMHIQLNHETVPEGGVPDVFETFIEGLEF